MITILLAVASIASASGGELQPIIAEYSCGAGADKFEIYFARKQDTSDLLVYRIAKNRSVAVMPTGLKADAKFNIDAQTISFDNSLCTYAFEKGSLKTLSCDGDTGPPKTARCERTKTVESMN